MTTTLSLSKLEKYLAKNEMIPNNFFIDKNGVCVYIEIFTIKNNNSFLLYIPAKYQVKVEYKTNIFVLNKHAIDEGGDLLEQMTDKSSVKKGEYGYDEITMTNRLGETNAEDKYNRPIRISQKEMTTMKGIYRQVRRLGLCMQGTKYGICVTNSSHMYCATDSDIYGYSITTEEHKHKYRKYFVVVDIEFLYAKVKNIVTDVLDIKRSISEVLTKNLSNHVNTISTAFVGYDVRRREMAVNSKITEYKTRLLDVEKILTGVLESETKVLEKRMEADERLRVNTRNILQRDIERTKQLRTYDIKLEEFINTKKELFRNIVSLKIKHDHTALISDDIMFDVAVMCEDIIKKMTSIDNL
jgi:hypothetical protein